MTARHEHDLSADKIAQRVIASRRREMDHGAPILREAEEGGCGVVGFAASVPVPGRHIFEPSIQMHNRGNGKGGGIACAGSTTGNARPPGTGRHWGYP